MNRPAENPHELNWYGLRKMGYGPESIPLTGDRTRDQIAIESICFRIGHTEEEGGLGRFGHFKAYVDLLWNNPESGSMKRCIWNPWANRMFRKMCVEPELGIAGPTSAGKCFSLDTGILMFDGSTKRANEIVPGDQVMGDDSKPRTVQEVHRGHGPMFRVRPEHGEPWYCTEEHVLVLKRTFASKKSWRRLGEVVEIPAKEYFGSSHTKKRMHRQFCVGVDFPESPVEFDPRLFGIWLGDGSRYRCKISLPHQEPEVFAYVKKWVDANGYDLREEKNPHLTCPTYAICPNGHVSAGSSHNPLWRFLKKPMVRKEKRIPQHYLINSREVRMNLLAGMLDTDGYAGRTYFEIATKFPGLKDDIVFLARSLGFRVSAVFRMVKCGEKSFPSWRINIFGSVTEIPTLRKKCQEKTLRKISDCTGITVTPAGDMDWVGFSVDGNHRFLLSDFTVVHNSDPAALYGVVSYTTDPTHTLVLVMSTTIAGAKKRIWKTVREYWESIPNLPGKPLWSTNEVRGLNYNGDGYGESSGLYLLASEQSNEKAALDKIIGIKAPRTGEAGATYEELIVQPEYADLRKHFSEDILRDLVPRLHNLSQDRIGKLILIVDEATGMVESILNAVNTNLKPGNVGHFQIILLGNPNLPYDPFGLFCKPASGWDGVDLLKDEEWRTETGGLCIRFNGEHNPRIMEQNDRYSWMLRLEDIKGMADKYGRDSLFYHRMVLGTWCLTGGELGIYSPADIELSGSRRSNVVWGYKAPTPCSFLDPAFTAGGDRAMARFGLCGEDINGEHVLLLTESVAIKVDVNDTTVPVNYQIVRGWKKECMLRGVLPQHAAYDRTGGGIPFGDIVITQWSNLVTGVTSGGPASKNPIPGEFKPGGKPGQKPEPVLACERFANRATEIWYSAQPLFRSQQIFGVDEELAKELCTRQQDKKQGMKFKIEDKPTYRGREGKSPDDSDSALGLVDFCRTKFKLLPTEKAKAAAERPATESARNVIHTLRERARRITNKRSLKRG